MTLQELIDVVDEPMEKLIVWSEIVRSFLQREFATVDGVTASIMKFEELIGPVTKENVDKFLSESKVMHLEVPMDWIEKWLDCAKQDKLTEE